MLLLAVLSLATLAGGATLVGQRGNFGSPMAGMPTIQSLEAKCGRSGMTVNVVFDQAFPGVIYSKGHYSDKKCQYVTEKTSGDREFTFLIPVSGCGTRGQFDEPAPGRDMYFENTIIVQLDPIITEVWDEARQLKCIWPHSMQRTVQATPFEVQAPERVTVEFDQRSINTLMEIQQGPGPFSAPATGYVYMGDDTSIVIYVQDPSGQVDANVVNCDARSSTGGTVDLVDTFGCLTRPDLMTHFDKSRKTNGIKADLMLYSYLKAFRIGDSPDFKIRCQLEVCRGKCNDPCTNGPVIAKRKKRSASLQKPSSVLQTVRSTPNMGSSRPEDLLTVVEEIEEMNEELSNPRVDLEQAVLVVEREQLESSNSWCYLSPSILIAGLVLLCIISLLSLLSCYLAVRLSKYTSKK